MRRKPKVRSRAIVSVDYAQEIDKTMTSSGNVLNLML